MRYIHFFFCWRNWLELRQAEQETPSKVHLRSEPSAQHTRARKHTESDEGVRATHVVRLSLGPSRGSRQGERCTPLQICFSKTRPTQITSHTRQMFVTSERSIWTFYSAQRTCAPSESVLGHHDNGWSTTSQLWRLQLSVSMAVGIDRKLQHCLVYCHTLPENPHNFEDSQQWVSLSQSSMCLLLGSTRVVAKCACGTSALCLSTGG